MTNRTSILAILVLATAAVPALAQQRSSQSEDGNSHRYPVVHGSYSDSFRVHGNDWECFHLILKKNQRYRVTVEHATPVNVAQPAGYTNIKLLVKRYWKGRLKSKSPSVRGNGRVSYELKGTHHGDRPFKFCIHNGLNSHHRFHFRIEEIR